jgi:hypothetical protein
MVGFWTSELLTVRSLIFLISSGLGIPGVGVAPLGSGLPKVAGSGMPGVGVAPFGILLALAGSGIPGVAFPEGVIGWVESPSGIFAVFVLILEFGLLLLGVVAGGWQPIPARNPAQTTKIKTFFIIS